METTLPVPRLYGVFPIEVDRPVVRDPRRATRFERTLDEVKAVNQLFWKEHGRIPSMVTLGAEDWRDFNAWLLTMRKYFTDGMETAETALIRIVGSVRIDQTRDHVVEVS